MKKRLLVLLFAAGAAAPSANSGIILTIDTSVTDADTFAIDFNWGAALPPAANMPFHSTFVSAPDGSLYGGALAESWGVGDWSTASLMVGSLSGNTVTVNSELFFPLGGDRLFVLPTVASGEAPTSVTPSDDGYGAYVVYEQPGNGTSPVPDTGSSAALFGLALAGCAGLRKWVAKET